MFNVGLLVLVEMHLKEPGAIELDPDPLAHNLRGIHKIIEDGIVHSDEGATPGPLLLQLICLPRRLRQDPPLRDEDHVVAGKLLLQLPHETDLDLLEGALLGHGHEDDDGLFAADVHLFGRRDVQLAELGLEVGIDLQVEEGLRDQLLEVVGLVMVGLDNLGAGCKSHLKKGKEKRHFKTSTLKTGIWQRG